MQGNRQLSTYGTAAAAAKSFQSCPTLCDPMVGCSPGSSVHRILQPRTLEWVAISFYETITLLLIGYAPIQNKKKLLKRNILRKKTDEYITEK